MGKENKTILGTDIQETSEGRTWRCTIQTADGEIVTISSEVLLKLLVDYNIQVEKYGNHYRAKEITK
jgi:hypothetical protein